MITPRSDELVELTANLARARDEIKVGRSMRAEQRASVPAQQNPRKNDAAVDRMRSSLRDFGFNIRSTSSEIARAAQALLIRHA